VLSGFDRVKESRDAMRAITLDEAKPKCSPVPRWPQVRPTDNKPAPITNRKS
jgi:hypothetical protein